MRAMVVAGFLAGVSTGAMAADKPLYQPAPAWVRTAPALDVAHLTDEAPILLRFDHQDRLEGASVWSYADIATRLASPEIVAQAGTLSLPWNPAKGDLIVHRVEILRGTQVVDVLAGDRRFEVIRREQQLEQRQLDGLLTATMPIEGLRVGDVLHVVASVTRREPAFGTQTQTTLALPQLPMKVGFARARVLWPAASDTRWRVYVPGVTGAVATVGGDREMSVEGALPKATELPDDAPLRYRSLPLVEASTFADWAAVSRVMAPLYATEGAIKPGGPLAAEVARIAAASADPTRRAALALQSVQEQVRYLLNGLGNGNYVPQAPEQTWAMRFGDCKAKTLLLMAMLRQLGIEAEPVLASSGFGDLLPARLPGPGAFDHVLVRATVAGDSLWLDGTGGAAREIDLHDTPPLRWVLPVRSAGAPLLAVPMRAPASANTVVVLDLDQRAGIGFPTLVHAVVTVHGPIAEMVGLARTQGSKDDKDQAIGQMIASVLGRELALSSYTLAYDPTKAEATVDATGLASQLWRRQDGRYRLVLDRVVDGIGFEPDRARAAWRDIPVATGLPERQDLTVRVQLPGSVNGFALEGDTTLATPLAGTHVTRVAALSGTVATLTDRGWRDGEEIAVSDVPAERARVAQAKKRLLTLVAPATLPTRARWVEAGRADGRFKPALAAYTAAIAADPEEVTGYVNRAAFNIGLYDWRAALPDLDRMIALRPSVAFYLQRAEVQQIAGQDAKALGDLRAAVALDPGSDAATTALADYLVQHGKKEEGLALAQTRIDAGGSGKAAAMAQRASLLGRAGDRDAALQLMDAAVTVKPGDPGLLNERCWLKGQLNTQLDTALKDCTKSIELSEVTSGVLDSRALIFFRLGRYDDALADINAALDQSPDLQASLYLRGLIEHRMGKAADSSRDIAAATLMAPRIATRYAPYGIVP